MGLLLNLSGKKKVGISTKFWLSNCLYCQRELTNLSAKWWLEGDNFFLKWTAEFNRSEKRRHIEDWAIRNQRVGCKEKRLDCACLSPCAYSLLCAYSQIRKGRPWLLNSSTDWYSTCSDFTKHGIDSPGRSQGKTITYRNNLILFFSQSKDIMLKKKLTKWGTLLDCSIAEEAFPSTHPTKNNNKEFDI